MKTSLQVLVAGLVLLTQGFAQEPKQLLAKQVTSEQTRKDTVVTGASAVAAPVVEPKPLPPMNPPLGDIARLARAARSAAPKALVVVDTDTAAPQEAKADQPEAKADQPETKE